MATGERKSQLCFVILAGGFGTRMGDSSRKTPKPMLELGNGPILWNIIISAQQQGIRDFLILSGYLADQIYLFFKFLPIREWRSKSNCELVDITANGFAEFEVTGPDLPIKVRILNTGENRETGERVNAAKDLLAYPEFILTYGDGLSDVSIDALLDATPEGSSSVLAVNPVSRFGHLTIGNNQVVESFQEKPKLKSLWVSGGWFLLDHSVLDLLHEAVGAFEGGPISALADGGELLAHKHTGFWQSIDTPRDLAVVREMVKEGDTKWLLN